MSKVKALLPLHHFHCPSAEGLEEPWRIFQRALASATVPMIERASGTAAIDDPRRADNHLAESVYSVGLSVAVGNPNPETLKKGARKS